MNDYSEPKRANIQIDDEWLAFHEVRRRRVMAFIIDYIAILILWGIFGVVVFFLGILTFGAAWFLYPILGGAVAICYLGLTMGGPQQATPGMRMMELEIVRLDGRNIDFMTAVLHGVIFWAGQIVTSGFIILISFFTDRKRLVQDLLLGTVVRRNTRS